MAKMILDGIRKAASLRNVPVIEVEEPRLNLWVQSRPHISEPWTPKFQGNPPLKMSSHRPANTKFSPYSAEGFLIEHMLLEHKEATVELGWRLGGLGYAHWGIVAHG